MVFERNSDNTYNYNILAEDFFSAFVFTYDHIYERSYLWTEIFEIQRKILFFYIFNCFEFKFFIDRKINI